MSSLIVMMLLSQVRSDVTEASADAKVLIVTPKKVHVTSVLAQDYEAMVGTLLLGTDNLKVPPDATVALRLKNGHVVRLDDDLELRVDQIALFKAPAKKDDPATQLDLLFSAEEKTSGQARLMGWNAGQTAANVKSSSDVVARDEGQLSKKATQKSRSAADEAEPRAELPSSPAAAPAPPTPPVRPAPGGDAMGGGGARGGGLAVSALTSDEQLARCVSDSLAVHGADFKRTLNGHLTLHLRNTPQRLHLHFGNYLPVPACAKDWAEAHRAQISGAITVDVPVK
jgi:hypothetical protein